MHVLLCCYCVFVFFYLATLQAYGILVPRPGIESLLSVLEVGSLKPLDCEESPNRYIMQLSFVPILFSECL